MIKMKRQTAYKLWIGDIIDSDIKIDENGYKYYDIRDKNVIRVNIIANVIHRYDNDEGTYSNLVVDDSSGQIKLKCWNEDTPILENVEVGDIVLIIGKLGSSESDVFIRPEIVKRIDNYDWELLRRIELSKLYGKPLEKQKNFVEKKEDKNVQVTEEKIEQTVSVTSREKIVDTIEKNDGEIEISELIKLTGILESEVDKVIEELLKEGEIYQPKPGFVKLLI